MDFFRNTRDGIYSSAQAAFIEAAPEGAEVTPLYESTAEPDHPVLAGKEYLRDTVLFYGLRLGEDIKTTADKRADIFTRLDAIDVESMRPQRAITAGTGTQADEDRLKSLEAEAEALRAELAALKS